MKTRHESLKATTPAGNLPHPGERWARIWDAIESVTDPEIPVLNIVDMGLVADVRVEDAGVAVDITPTFVGCPAVDLIRENIRVALAAIGEPDVRINLVFDPPWTTERMTEQGRNKLKEVGFSPPLRAPIQIGMPHPPVACPHCNSTDTQLESMFGPTLCRAIYYCRACLQSFEHFKSVE